MVPNETAYGFFRKMRRNSSRPIMWRLSKNFTIACKAAVGFVTDVAFNCIAGMVGVSIREPRITDGCEIERTNSRSRSRSSSEILVNEIPMPRPG